MEEDRGAGRKTGPFFHAVCPRRRGSEASRDWLRTKWPVFRSGWATPPRMQGVRSEEHTSEIQSLMRISYAVFCFTKKITMKHPQLHQKHNIQDTLIYTMHMIC